MANELYHLQKEIDGFVRQHDLNEDVVCRMLDLSSEVGELAKEVLKGTDYGRRDFVLANSFQEELGDILFEVICLANASDTDLTDALYATLHKMEERIKTYGHPGSGK